MCWLNSLKMECTGALQLKHYYMWKSRWKIKWAFLKRSRRPYFASNHRFLKRFEWILNIVLHYYWTWIRDFILNDYRSALEDSVYWKVPQNSKTHRNYNFPSELLRKASFNLWGTLRINPLAIMSNAYINLFFLIT